MRYVRILFLHFQDVFESRGRAFVWFLTITIYPLLLILFWSGASSKKPLGNGWNLSLITSYYFFLTVAFSLLISHVEEGVSKIDIREGMLVAYLLRPFSYYWKKFFEELTARVFQSVYAVVFCLVVVIILRRNIFVITHDPALLLMSTFLIIGAVMLSFTIKMTMGICTFWFLDIRGSYEVMYMIEMIFSGLLMPLIFLPSFFQKIAYLLPFSYIVYFPVSAILGRLSMVNLIEIFLAQMVWLASVGLIYHFLWIAGVRKFSAVGQ